MAVTFVAGQTIRSADVNANFLEKTDKATLTTKGDVYVATGAGTVVRQAVGSDDKAFVADSSQTNGVAYHTELDGSYLKNLSLAASVASNALTISLKTAAGSDASATDPVKIGFRSATLATGSLSLVKVSAALSTVISSGSTAGHVSAAASWIYVYALNNAGAVELAWSTAFFDENVLVTTTAEGGAGAADSATVMYSTTARASVAFRLIGKLLSTQTTAGTWAAVPTNIMSGDAAKLMINRVPNLTLLTCTSATKTPTATNTWQAMTGNSVALTPGVWELNAWGQWTASGATGLNFALLTITGANGADSGVTPTLLTAVTNLTINSSFDTAGGLMFSISSTNDTCRIGACGPVFVTVTAAVTIYVTTFCIMTTAANTRVIAGMTARQLY